MSDHDKCEDLDLKSLYFLFCICIKSSIQTLEEEKTVTAASMLLVAEEASSSCPLTSP